MKATLKRLLAVVLALVFLVSMGMVIFRGVEARQAAALYDQARETAQTAETTAAVPVLKPVSPKAADPETPEETPAPPEPDPFADALAATDLDALRETNPEVLGWISIPDTTIDYPICRHEDNRYYLNHTWMKTRNSAGAIFMEHTNSPDFSGFSTILYGHRMKNGSMFAPLLSYKQQTYFMEHPCVYVLTDQGVLRYRVYAAYEAPLRSPTYYLEFPGQAEKMAFIDYGYTNSKVASGIIPGTDDRILTLSTCTGTGYANRWVVQAVLDAVYQAE